MSHGYGWLFLKKTQIQKDILEETKKHSERKIWMEKLSNLICRQAEEENYWEEEKKKKKKWIRDNMNMCQCTGPASQITILEKKKKTYMNDFIRWQSFHELSPWCSEQSR